MTNHLDSAKSDALDVLITQLLDCGGVLSQMIGRMVQFDAAGKSSPDAAPIPEIAHSLIYDAVCDVARRRSKRDITVAAAIVEDVTEAICEEIFLVDPKNLGDPEAN